MVTVFGGGGNGVPDFCHLLRTDGYGRENLRDFFKYNCTPLGWREGWISSVNSFAGDEADDGYKGNE